MNDTKTSKTRTRRKVRVIDCDGIAVREIRPSYFMADLYVNGKRERPCFDSLDKAKVWCHEKAIEYRNFGLSSFNLTEGERFDARRALDILSGTATLAAAAQEYIRRHPLKKGESIARTAAKYIRQMMNGGCRPLSIKEKRCKFRLLCADFKYRATVSFDESDFAAWVDAKGYTGTNRENYLNACRSLLNFFHGKKRTKRQRDERPPATWPASLVKKLFHTAEQNTPAMIPALTVLFFCGLRPHEMMRLTWGHIDLDDGHVNLTADICKTRTSRQVEIPHNAQQWLAKYRHESGKIIASESTYRTTRETLMKKAELTEWPVDIARHTYATAHYTAHSDAAKTAQQLGHFGNLEMFVRHYKGQMKTKDAADYWKILPHEKHNVIQLVQGVA
jgi:integrase